MLSFIDTINGIIKQVDDIYYAGKLSSTKAEDLYNKTIKYINKKREAIAENESKVYHNHIKPTQELIFSSYDIIKRFRTDIKGMEKYKSGAVSKIDGLEELRKCRCCGISEN
ncbi:MAG: hypothetical protein IIT48_07455 [Lachnospiraceae bacterium]|nr:hypothetical protein [Lachnospiraceae bacterium]